MRRDLLTVTVRVVAPATIALVVVFGVAPGRFELALRIYALLVAALVIGLALLALRHAYPPETTLADPAPTARQARQPASVERTHNDVVLGVAGAVDLHYRLAPRLRAVAAGLLASRRNVSLVEDRKAARALVGDEAWELVRPDRRAPHDRLGTGVEPDRLARVVDALGAI